MSKMLAFWGIVERIVAETSSQPQEATGDESQTTESSTEEGGSSAYETYDATTSEQSSTQETMSSEYESEEDSFEELQSTDDPTDQTSDEFSSPVSEESESAADEMETVRPDPSAGLSKKELNKQKNVEEAAKNFGSTGAKFAELKGADKFNARQKAILDEKLKKMIEKDPRAKKGAMSEKQLKALAQKAADAATKLSQTKLGKDVNEMALKSESLKDTIVDLQNRGWKIKVGKRGGGSFANSAKKTITIDPGRSTKAIVISLAHESGHANYVDPPDPPVEDPSPTIAKGEAYIRKIVEINLLNEGQAQIVACKTAAELEAAGETDIKISGGHSDQYKAVYKKIVDGTYTMDQGRKEMAKIMGTEITSNSGENYVDYYSKAPRKTWNKAHPEAIVPDTTRVTVFP